VSLLASRHATPRIARQQAICCATPAQASYYNAAVPLSVAVPLSTGSTAGAARLGASQYAARLSMNASGTAGTMRSAQGTCADLANSGAESALRCGRGAYPGGAMSTSNCAYAHSPRMRRASCMSFGKMVVRLAWMAQRLVSSKRPTR